MAKGDVVYSTNTISDWDYVAPDTFGESIWKIACEKSKEQGLK